MPSWVEIPKVAWAPVKEPYSPIRISLGLSFGLQERFKNKAVNRVATQKLCRMFCLFNNRDRIKGTSNNSPPRHQEKLIFSMPAKPKRQFSEVPLRRSVEQKWDTL